MTKSILDREFRYVRSEKTDIAKTFARVRREQKEAELEREAKVKQLRKKVG